MDFERNCILYKANQRDWEKADKRDGGDTESTDQRGTIVLLLAKKGWVREVYSRIFGSKEEKNRCKACRKGLL